MSETDYHSLPRAQTNDFTIKKKYPILLSRKSSQVEANPWRFFVRVAAFVALEGGFITLAACATLNPVTLPVSPDHLAEAEAVTTLLTIIWHAIVVFLVKVMVLHVFSAEWMEQVRRSGRIVLDKSDQVSRITSGSFDQVRHLNSPTATVSYHLGFITSLLLLAASGLGPGAITVNSIFFPVPSKVQVGI